MANALILHGTSSTPRHFWFPWLGRELERRGNDVWAPQLPNADSPCLESWLPFVLDRGTFSGETVLVAHSAGCPLALSVLENISVRVRKVVLVAGYAHKLATDAPDRILQDSYRWERIRENLGSLVLINSDDDPWGCDDTAGRYIFDHLGGTLIIRHNQGHMGSERFNQPYERFPLLLDLIESEIV